MADETAETETEKKPKRGAAAAAKAKAGADLVRLRVAQLVWLVCVLAALTLALGALLIALKDSVNRGNDAVKFLLDLANKLDLTVFDRKDGVFDFDDKNAQTAEVKNALLNWGLAAIAWLIAGRIVDRIIRP